MTVKLTNPVAVIFEREFGIPLDEFSHWLTAKEKLILQDCLNDFAKNVVETMLATGGDPVRVQDYEGLVALVDRIRLFLSARSAKTAQRIQEVKQ